MHLQTMSVRNAKCCSFVMRFQIARLYLVSDILYNSSAKVPNASFYRKWSVLCLPSQCRLQAGVRWIVGLCTVDMKQRPVCAFSLLSNAVFNVL